MNIKHFLLKNKVIREFLFFLFHKKVNKKKIDKLILKYKLQKKLQYDFVISMTSFPGRINEVIYSVYSMLNQTIMPKKIYLWLAEEQFPKRKAELPMELLALENEVFEIKWCSDLRSYKKLIPILDNNIHENVIICDDDIFYRKKTLEILWKSHLKHEEDVICHIGKELSFDLNKKLIPYVKWNWTKSCTTKRNVLPIGGGCVFYPEKVLYNSPLLLEKNNFMKLSKYADDIWFWYSIISAGYKITIPKRTIKKMIYTNPEREYGITDDFTLTKLNEGEDMNDLQLKNIMDYYNINIYSFTKD